MAQRGGQGLQGRCLQNLWKLGCEHTLQRWPWLPGLAGWDIPTWSDLIWKVSCRVKRELQSNTICHSLEVTACLHDQQELPGQGQDSLILPQISPCFWKFLLASVLVNSNAEKSLPQVRGLAPLINSCSCPFASAWLHSHWPWIRITFLPQFSKIGISTGNP